MHLAKRKLIILLVALCCLSLCACTTNVQLASGKYRSDVTSLTTVIRSEELELLDRFTALRSADFSGSDCAEEIYAWAKLHPDVVVSYTVTFPGGVTVESDVQSLDMSGIDLEDIGAVIKLISCLPDLKELRLNGSHPSGEQLSTLLAAFPELELADGVYIGRQCISLDVTELDLSRANAAELASYIEYLPFLTKVSTIELGSEGSGGAATWEDIAAIRKAAGDGVALNYTFTLYGKSFTLMDEIMDLNHIPVGDEGELVRRVTACMPKLKFLDMDSCGVPDEAMAEIRDFLPNTKVVWRVFFGNCYSVRTDVERILASNPDRGGNLCKENTRGLLYCTDVKYLDIGHNTTLDTIDFTANMPKLEVAIFAISAVEDFSPLANCPELEYLEMFSSCLNDLSFISGLKNLRHLNICYCFALRDISPLYSLTGLERLWIGLLDPIPLEQIEAMRQAAPGCEIDTTALDPTYGTWRFKSTGGYLYATERYRLLREQLKYDFMGDAYSYSWNDPLYYAH